MICPYHDDLICVVQYHLPCNPPNSPDTLGHAILISQTANGLQVEQGELHTFGNIEDYYNYSGWALWLQIKTWFEINPPWNTLDKVRYVILFFFGTESAVVVRGWRLQHNWDIRTENTDSALSLMLIIHSSITLKSLWGGVNDQFLSTFISMVFLCYFF